MAPTQAPYHRALGLAYQYNRNLPDAVKAFRRAVELDPKFADAFIDLGQAYLEQGDLPRAEQAVRAALANPLYPTPQRAHFTLGTIYQRQGRLEEAAGQFRRAVDVDPELANAHNSLGMIYLAQSKLDQAIVSFQTASRLRPNVAEVQGNLGIAYFRAGRRAEAKAALEQALKLQPVGPTADGLRDYLRRLK
jgi:superkiller protein 3